VAYLTSAEWDLIVDALTRTADAHRAAGQSHREAASTDRNKRVQHEHRVLAREHAGAAEVMRALAQKISLAAVDEIAGTSPEH
jgi:hypothetical protein